MLENKDIADNDQKLIESFLDGSMDETQRQRLMRAREIEAQKASVWVAVESHINHKTETKVVSMWPRKMMRYAAIMLPFLVIGLVWAGNAIGLFNFTYENAEMIEKAGANVMPVKTLNQYIRFDGADIEKVTTTLLNYYPEIKGVKAECNISQDSVKITTSFNGQPLNEVLEELQIHFNHNFALDSDGYLIISD